jgi:hypothetical protein
MSALGMAATLRNHFPPAIDVVEVEPIGKRLSTVSNKFWSSGLQTTCRSGVPHKAQDARQQQQNLASCVQGPYSALFAGRLLYAPMQAASPKGQWQLHRESQELQHWGRLGALHRN